MAEEQYPPIPSKLMVSGGAAGGSAERYYPSTPGGAAGGADEPIPPPGDTGAPAGPGFNRTEFIKNYANMVAQTWVDDSYLQLILAKPAETLAAAGLPTAGGATIRPIQCKLTGSGQITDQVAAWVEGNRTGLYDLWLPIKPDDVDVSPGGGAPDACAGGASCCCTPCCSCT